MLKTVYVDGEALIRARQNNNLSQKAVAERIGFTQQALSNIERGGYVKERRALSIAQAIGCAMSEFCRADDGGDIELVRKRRERTERIARIKAHLDDAADWQLDEIDKALALDLV